MKRAILALLLLGWILPGYSDQKAYEKEAKAITEQFFNALKSELSKSMSAGGPSEAARACRGMAPAIADKYARLSGWQVGRTSLKWRNPNNQPDEWERQVLNKFERLNANGASADRLVYSEVITGPQGKAFRYMKGIVMPPLEAMPCLSCHGTSIDERTRSVLRQAYPEDKAVGYHAGEVRGAFTLIKPL